MARPSPGTSTSARVRTAFAAALVLAVPAPARASTPDITLPGCTPSAELRAALVEPQEVGARCGGDAACWRAALDAARALRDRFADQYDAHRAYVLTARAAVRAAGAAHLAPLAAEYEALARAHPASPAYRHLYAQLVLEAGDYRHELEQIATVYPDYPWAHLSLAFQVRAGASEEARDRGRTSLARFLAICPERVAEAARGLELVGDPELIRAHAARLRKVALAHADADSLALLWPLSVRAAEGESREAVAAAVAGELASFATRAGADSLAGLRAQQRGFDALGDRPARTRVEDALLAREPCGEDASRIRQNRFREGHTAPAGEDAAARAAWLEAALAEVERALEACPGDEWALGMRVRLLSNAPAAREPELLAAVDRLLALPPRRSELPPSPAGWAAGLYLERGVRLDRVPALLEEDLVEAGAEFQRRSAAGDPEAEPRHAWRRRENLRLRIGYALAISDSAAARRALDELARETDAAPGGGVVPAFRGAARFPDERTELDRLAARVLTAEGRGEDALGLLARLLPDPVLGPAVEREARAAWRAAHGAEEGFEAWRTGLAGGLAVAPWQAADRLPPAIPLSEFGGGPWSWGAQRGRTVVLFVWATWCTPCRDELPWLERLGERLAGRPDVAVVTVNVDRTNASLLPYLGEHDLALPVLTGGDRLFDEGLPGVPALWIVAPDGRVRRELRGFAGGDEEWLAAAMAEVEAVAGPAPVVSGGS